MIDFYGKAGEIIDRDEWKLNLRALSSENYIAEGCKPVKRDDGTWELTPGIAVIEGVPYVIAEGEIHGFGGPSEILSMLSLRRDGSVIESTMESYAADEVLIAFGSTYDSTGWTPTQNNARGGSPMDIVQMAFAAQGRSKGNFYVEPIDGVDAQLMRPESDEIYPTESDDPLRAGVRMINEESKWAAFKFPRLYGSEVTTDLRRVSVDGIHNFTNDFELRCVQSESRDSITKLRAVLGVSNVELLHRYMWDEGGILDSNVNVSFSVNNLYNPVYDRGFTVYGEWYSQSSNDNMAASGVLTQIGNEIRFTVDKFDYVLGTSGYPHTTIDALIVPNNQ